MELGQGKCARNESVMEKDSGRGYDQGVPAAEIWAPSDRFSGYANGQKPKGSQRHHRHKQPVRRHHQ